MIILYTIMQNSGRVTTDKNNMTHDTSNIEIQ